MSRPADPPVYAPGVVAFFLLSSARKVLRVLGMANFFMFTIGDGTALRNRGDQRRNPAQAVPHGGAKQPP